MIARIHSHQEHRVLSLFHQGLIKLLIVFHLKKKGKTWEDFLFVSGFDAEKQKGEVKEREDVATGNQTEQDLEPANEAGKELGEKWSEVNDELSEACAIKNDDKGVDSKEIAKVKSVENLKAKGTDLISKPRTRLRSKLEVEISPNPILNILEGNEMVVIEESLSKEKVQLINEEHISEGENFIELQRMAEHIPESFCTIKQNYVENDVDLGVKSLQ